jgi:hypothetical protein
LRVGLVELFDQYGFPDAHLRGFGGQGAHALAALVLREAAVFERE